MTGTDVATLLLAPDAPPGWAYDTWPERLPDHLIAVSGRFDPRWERAALEAAEAAGRALLSIRVAGAEALIGPLQPVRAADDRSAGCAGCAQERDQSAGQGDSGTFGLESLVELHLGVLAEVPLAAGELVAIAADGTARRHHVARTHRCPVCGSGEPRTAGHPTRVPAPTALTPRPTDAKVPTRGAPPFGLDPTRMRRELVDPRYGPITRVRRKGDVPFAMTEAGLVGARYPGYGRGRTFRTADAVAILEGYERSANTPQTAEVVLGISRRDLGPLAMDPARLGRYTERQLAAPGARLRRYGPDVPMDWVWSHRLRDGSPLLVPAEIGFYLYAHPEQTAAGAGRTREVCFDESSSGSALGGSYEEAVLHSLMELAERDAFLLAWYRAAPLPRIDPATLADPECGMLLDIIGGLEYDVHLLAITADLGIPAVWALAVHRELRFPAAFSAAGAGPDPVEAIRSALWELGQLVGTGQELDEAAARNLAEDPWRIHRIEDHILLNALPDRAPRAQRVLGGPVVSLAEAFPGWPERFVRHAEGDVTGALRYVAALYADAGLDEILVVDQSSTEHRLAGLSAVKAVVPGIAPMCFGTAHQRMAGVPRLEAAARAGFGGSADESLFPLDPHPFP